MKTKLLYISSFLLVLFTSCSIDENREEPSEQEKELKIKSLVDAFVKDVIPSPAYAKFIEEVRTKSSEWTSEEETQLEQELLSQQTPEFVALYYYVVELDLSKNELRNFIFEYFEASKSRNIDLLKSEEDDCSAAETSSTSLFSFLSHLICEVIKENG
ncbi:hypothetical protein J8L88_14715 [Aquimarina sp. MMG015]|uniref:hypothetical protein n=1 Tax=Aquimarina sp. MMG015 TaxID=2822689 RepID=UPI001B39FC42|nr:hypothetical protein [Aquimarina sp. MMG015]MBQ4804112.1 hypothetical protein [Aquimarina sp. MMG015]